MSYLNWNNTKSIRKLRKDIDTLIRSMLEKGTEWNVIEAELKRSMYKNVIPSLAVSSIEKVWVKPFSSDPFYSRCGNGTVYLSPVNLKSNIMVKNGVFLGLSSQKKYSPMNWSSGGYMQYLKDTDEFTVADKVDIDSISYSIVKGPEVTVSGRQPYIVSFFYINPVENSINTEQCNFHIPQGKEELQKELELFIRVYYGIENYLSFPLEKCSMQTFNKGYAIMFKDFGMVSLLSMQSIFYVYSTMISHEYVERAYDIIQHVDRKASKIYSVKSIPPFFGRYIHYDPLNSIGMVNTHRSLSYVSGVGSRLTEDHIKAIKKASELTEERGKFRMEDIERLGISSRTVKHLVDKRIIREFEDEQKAMANGTITVSLGFLSFKYPVQVAGDRIYSKMQREKYFYLPYEIGYIANNEMGTPTPEQKNLWDDKLDRLWTKK